jgi:hypothetical protein
MTRTTLAIGIGILVAVLSGCAQGIQAMGPPTYGPNAVDWSGEPAGIYVGIGGPTDADSIEDLRIVVRQVRTPIPAVDPGLPPQI